MQIVTGLFQRGGGNLSPRNRSGIPSRPASASPPSVSSRRRETGAEWNWCRLVQRSCSVPCVFFACRYSKMILSSFQRGCHIAGDVHCPRCYPPPFWPGSGDPITLVPGTELDIEIRVERNLTLNDRPYNFALNKLGPGFKPGTSVVN